MPFSADRSPLLPLLLVLALFPAACSQAPTSTQAIAHVNGEEITRRDLWIEAEASGADPATVSQEDKRVYLDRIIERKLLAQAARERGIDRSPEYFAALRRNRELILGGLLAREENTRADGYDDAEIDRYIAGNPQKFGQRQQLLVASVSVPRLPANFPADRAQDVTLDQLAARLDAAGIAYGRKREVIDTASLSPTAAARARDLAPGRALVIRDKGTLVAREVLRSWAVPTSGPPRDAARAMMRNEGERETAQRLVTASKNVAAIEFEPGWDASIRSNPE